MTPIRELPAHDELLTGDELAAYLGRPAKTLANWRSARTGPAYIKVGGTVRYRRRDVEAWLDEQTYGVPGDTA
jgi:excisionase family DNA binding protein